LSDGAGVAGVDVYAGDADVSANSGIFGGGSIKSGDIPGAGSNITAPVKATGPFVAVANRAAAGAVGATAVPGDNGGPGFPDEQKGSY